MKNNVFTDDVKRVNIPNITFSITTILVVIFTISLGIYEYQRDHEFRCDILHAKLQLNNYTRNDTSIRVTIIDTLGNVLYDSHEKDISKIGNHLDRKEVQEALHYMSGYDIKRISNLNGEKYFYSATYFPERGEIVRSSVPYSAPLTTSLERDYTSLYYTMGILTLIVIVLYFKARLTHSEQDKQRIKHQLTENAAHELKTPAATIYGYLETLIDNPTMPENKKNEFIERCFIQSKRMTNLLLDMSVLTQLDEVRFSRPTTNIDIADILNQISRETSSQFEERNIEQRLNIPESLPIDGDSSLIYSLFRNIFSNTIAYAAGANVFEINVNISKDKYTFTLADNGIGVSAEHIPHLFERFYRTDKGRSRRLGGTGLGLAIVKNIAIQYGGSARAYTTAGGGLTIEVILSKK
ncbi:MAG: HAMP domain-containing histidine kinase [Paludibacteraceae bacterium]|nr:HAMP domain-containing histidine kinase [Paludibacteraceae bacterium]